MIQTNVYLKSYLPVCGYIQRAGKRAMGLYAVIDHFVPRQFCQLPRETMEQGGAKALASSVLAVRRE